MRCYTEYKHMKKLLLVLVLALSLAFTFNYVLAQDDTTQDAVSDSVVAAAEEPITSQDLGISDPGILPTSRVYFLKNWGRSIKRTFTFNAVKKAELELDIANEQAAEIAKMKEVTPDRVGAITKASQNYQTNVDRLKNRLEALKETSQNPNVNTLMEKLADRSVKHQQLFGELKQKFENNPELKQKIGVMQDKMNEALMKVPEKFDSQEAFQQRMKRAIEARPDSPLRELRGMEMMEKIAEKLPENRRAGFDGVKNDLMEKFEERVNAMPEEAQRTFMVPHMLERMSRPGDPDFDVKMKVLEDIKGRVLMSPKMREQIESTQSQILEKAAEQGEIKKEKAEEQVRRAEESIKALGIAIDEPGAQITDTDITRMKNLLAQTKKHLDNAKTALAAGKYGEAFGQATSADMIARNALKGNVLFKSQPAPLLKPIPIPGIRPAPESISPPTSGTGTTNLLPPLNAGQIVCTQEFTPVCGVNGTTYPNKCHALKAGAAIRSLGACKLPGTTQ